MEELRYDIYNETWKASPSIKFTFSAVGYILTEHHYKFDSFLLKTLRSHQQRVTTKMVEFS
jgi:hypothetical protein